VLTYQKARIGAYRLEVSGTFAAHLLIKGADRNLFGTILEVLASATAKNLLCSESPKECTPRVAKSGFPLEVAAV
jgi:hypothetical protein